VSTPTTQMRRPTPRPATRPGPGPPAAEPSAPYTAHEIALGIALGALVAALWPMYLAIRGPAPVQVTVLTAHVAGMLAGYGVIVLVGLMSRAPALERGVGADRLARWHGWGGRAVVLLVVVHAWAAVAAWAGGHQESTGLAFWQVLRLPWLIAATLGTVLFLIVGAVSARAARRRMSYERWHAIHLLVYIAVALSFVHQLAGPDLAGHRVLQVLWALLYAHVFTLLLQHRLLTPLRNAGRHRLRVAAVVHEGPGVVSIVIEGRDLLALHAQAGQFFRWRFLAPDFWATAHPFSLSAPPTNTSMRLTVKALGDGSSRMQRLEAGTWVLAEGPYGAMTAGRRTQRNVLLVGGGVGITPMRALFETLPLAPGHDLLLLYRAKTADDLVFQAELDQIARRRGARVQYLVGDAVGRFTPELFQRLVPDLQDRDVYLCASPAMSDAVRHCMHDVGLPKGQFHEERFAF
jgi:predicted ferric reductase